MSPQLRPRGRAHPSFSVARTTVLVTGASRGMGVLHAHRAAADGARAVMLWGRSARRLSDARADLAAAHPATAFHADTVDVSSLDQVTAGATAMFSEVGVPDVLVNNAGIVTGAYFWEYDPVRDIHEILAVNAEGPLQVTRAFLPAMLRLGTEARIVTMASAAGLVSFPRASVYAASKAALIEWSDSLRLELAEAGHGRVRVMTVCPGFVSTGMFAGVRPLPQAPILDPHDVVDRIWDEVPLCPPFLLLPRAIRLSTLLQGVLPRRAFDRVVGRGIGVYDSMAGFVGHDGSGTEPGPGSSHR